MPKEQDTKAKNSAAKKTAEEKQSAGKAPSTGKKPAPKASAGKAPKERASDEKAPADKKPVEKKVAEKKVAVEKPVPKKTAAKKAGQTAEQQPAAATSGPAGTEPTADNPLHKKLGLRPGITGVVITPPEDNDNPLLPLPEGVAVLAQIDELSALAGPYDYIQVFAQDRGDLAGSFAALRDKLAPSGSLWISWMKQAGGRRRAGMFGDLNENIIRRLALTHGLVDVKVATLDRNWSALRLVHRKH